MEITKTEPVLPACTITFTGEELQEFMEFLYHWEPLNGIGPVIGRLYRRLFDEGFRRLI